MKNELKIIVEENTTVAGRRFDLVIKVLIFVVLIGYAIQTLPDLSPEYRAVLRYLEIACVAVFTMEYLLRLYVADNRWKFVFSFYGLIDLIAILPFYLTTMFPVVFSSGLDLRTLRIIRLFRLFRTLKMVRYSKALQLFHRAFDIAKEELTIFFIAIGMLLYLTAAMIYFFENPVQPELFSSMFSSLWWAVVTLTTVGYGDVYPISDGGRVFTFFLLLVGLGTIAIPSGIVASALGEARDMEQAESGPDSDQ
jgi:voltage-gated potassium channel